jgi:hypothetical protein
MIYDTRGKYADQYTIDAVEIEWVPAKNETLKGGDTITLEVMTST